MPAYSDDPDDNKMSLVEHLTELRTRLLWSAVAFVVAFFLCYGLAQHIYNFLMQPLASIMQEVGGSQRMIYTALTEAFFTYVAVAAFGAIVLTFPMIATQVWLFIAPGLYKHEKKALLPFLFASPVLFLTGAALVYYLVMPLAWRFLLGFQTTGAETVLPIELEAKVGEYLGLVMRLILAFGFCFQMPVALTLMARVGIVSSKTLADVRKYAIVGVFVLAAIVTPPDIISQVGLALPLILLYEASIWSCRYVERRRGDVDEDDAWLDDDEEEDGGDRDEQPAMDPTEGSSPPGTRDDTGPAAGVTASETERAVRGDTPDEADPHDEDDGPPDTDFNTGR